MERTLRPLAALLPLLLLLVACAERGSRGPGATETAAGASAEAPVVQTAGGLYPTGERLARYLRSKYPAYENGRWAVGWNSNIPWMTRLGLSVQEHWPFSVSLMGLGAVAFNSDQAYIQLDPSSFAGLIWLEPMVTPKGLLEAVKVTFRPIGALPYVQTIIACEPGLSIIPQAAPDGR
ncbi:MAG: hypothetical protein ACP5VF_08100 [Acidobacteriota bacterium]